MAARNNMESTLAAANPKDRRARYQKRDLFLIIRVRPRVFRLP
jgi:hypothetical protein